MKHRLIRNHKANLTEEEFEDTKGVIRIRKSKKILVGLWQQNEQSPLTSNY
jgi:hypothetical protein